MINQLIQNITGYRWSPAFGSKSINKHRYYYFEDIRTKYASNIPYKSLFHKVQRMESVSSSGEQVCFSLILKLGISIQEVKKRLSYTKYHIGYKAKGNKREILVYRFKMAGQNVKLQMHFFNGSLFYYNYNFAYLRKVEHFDFIQGITRKYNLDSIDFGKTVVKDRYENALVIDTDRELNIGFIATSHPFFNSIFDSVITGKEIFHTPSIWEVGLAKLKSIRAIL